MQIICERQILIHDRPVYRISEDYNGKVAVAGAVPTESELKKGRKCLIPAKDGIQEVPDWVAGNAAFKNLVQKGVIRVVKFVSTPVSAPVAAPEAPVAAAVEAEGEAETVETGSVEVEHAEPRKSKAAKR